MGWLREHLTLVRLCVLALLIIALLGPWVYENLSVPDEYDCAPSLVRIRPGFCGDPMSGWFVMGYFGVGFFGVLWALLSGATTFQEAGPNLIAGLVWLPVLPLLSSLLLLWRGERPRLKGAHMVALLLMIGLTLVFIIAEDPTVVSIHMWGPWLFLAALAAGLAVESVTAFRSRSGAEAA
ncbi:hypothetical protein LARV_00231 [Longilinea arvoryzae]|uniref:DUF998 domain-containing protein n=1 Tax=Longilinea arvoryzae TaxID=360412 RepID=A0A0S7BCK5_9CHLR|nr:hypothetical protein [Longilinea arvoryzae]GAP12496.1 hypothetical protein LARV_00231 [Longilinea arvoryzae]